MLDAMGNWCEYVSHEGEVKNVLQLCCECEDLDEAFTELVTPAAVARDGDRHTKTGPVWQRIFIEAQDRARVPWRGGARRVDLAWPLSAALVWMVRWQGRRSATLAMVLMGLLVCFSGLAYSHVRALRLRSRSQFHMAWLSLSVTGSYLRYLRDIRPAMTWVTDLVAHAALVLMAACYCYCCLADPGRGLFADIDLPEASNTDVGTTSTTTTMVDLAVEEQASQRAALLRLHEKGFREEAFREEQRQRSKILRSGRCGICRCTFRVRDHHCVWVGQCIAERNRRAFVVFLLLLSALSLWFAGEMMELSLRMLPLPLLCRWDGREIKWGVAGCLVRQGRGEEVEHAIYALVASVLSAALAFQQCLLVGAGVTSLELRRARNNAPLRRQEHPLHYSGLVLGASSREETPAGRGCSRGFTLFPPIGEYCRNWEDFLRGK